MDRKPFRVPITVFLDDSRTFHIITSVGDAADFLFDNWTGNDCASWMSAMDQCTLAMDGAAERDDARSAFLEAADNAGMRVSAIVAL